MKRIKYFLLNRLAAPAIYAFIWALCSTVRLTVEGKELEEESFRSGRPGILCCWHGRLLFLPYYYDSVRKMSPTVDVLTSPSGDGELVARIASMAGYGVARGSSYKNPRTALRELARRIAQGRWSGLIADGSRGPALIAQPGALMLAKLTGAQVFPATVAFQRHWTLKSWDRMIIPKPFTRGIVIHGQPISFPQGEGREAMAEKLAELDRELHRITDQADAYFHGS